MGSSSVILGSHARTHVECGCDNTLNTLRRVVMKTRQLRKLGNKEMLMSALIGVVAERLPLPKGKKPFYRRKEQLVEAGNYVLDAIDAGHIILRKETNCVEGNFKTLNYCSIVNGIEKVKDITRGFEELPGVVHQKTVGAYRLRPTDVEILDRLSSIPFSRSEYCDEAFLAKVHSLAKMDVNSKELLWKRTARYEEYRKTALKQDRFYLSAKYDGRGRMGYEGARLEGLRPHGKCYESACFELNPTALSVKGTKCLEDLSPEPIELEDANTKHELLNYIRQYQIDDALSTGTTGMTVECDITNSGLLIAGLSFKSTEMLKATNGYGSDTKADSHTVFGDVYGLDRDTAKKVHTPLLHGASNKSIANELTEATGNVYTAAQVIKGNEKAYGKAVHNINKIAQYGKAIMSNYRSEVSWIMPDGFRSTHKAYTLHVPLELQLRNRKVKVMSGMPLLLDKQGNPVYDNNTPGKDEEVTISTKMMGLYANIIHSIDSYVMRRVIASGIELLAKHDAFLVHPNNVGALTEELQKIYSEVYEMDLVREILDQIEETTGIAAPEMFIGTAVNKMLDSKQFITVE